MITILYNILSKIKGRRSSLFFYRVIKLILNVYYPLHCKIFKDYKYKYIDESVMVSLTSFPGRIDTVWITIETLLRQTVKPKSIELWLADTQFENVDKLPKELLSQRERGLKIRFCEDLRSHKKYYFTMLENPNNIVITVDDDTFYPENLIEGLLETHKKHPNSVCCNLAHRIVYNDQSIAPYNDWIKADTGSEEPSYQLLPVGCQGVLYPPGSLNKNLFNKNEIFELCPLADDLWLKGMALLNDVAAVKNPKESITYANLLSSKKESLNQINVNQNKNDEQLINILNKYPELEQIIKEK